MLLLPLNPKVVLYFRCETVAHSCKVKVEFVDGVAGVDTERYQEPESPLPKVSSSGTVPAYVPMYVNVINEPRKSNIGCSNYKDLKKFNYDFEILSEPATKRTSNTIFKIYRPYKEYWFFHHFHRYADDFTESMDENMSDSFMWLLRELSNMVKSEIKEVYWELHLIESVLYSLLVDGDYERRCSRYLRPNEW